MKKLTIITDDHAKAWGVKLTAATLKTINAIAETVQPMLESETKLKSYLTGLLSSSYKTYVDGKLSKSVKFSANEKHAHGIVLAALEVAGLYDIAKAKENVNKDRKKMKPAVLENVRKYQSTSKFITRAIKLANGDQVTEVTKPTVKTTVSSVKAKAEKLGTKAAKVAYITGVRDGLTALLATL